MLLAMVKHLYTIFITLCMFTSLLFLCVIAEKDLLLLGMISTQMNTGALTACSKRKSQSSREHQRTSYMVDGLLVCRDTFKFVNRLLVHENNYVVFKKDRCTRPV